MLAHPRGRGLPRPYSLSAGGGKPRPYILSPWRYPEPVTHETVAAPSQRSAAAEALWVLGWAAAWLVPFGVFVFFMIPAGYGMFGRSWVGGIWFVVATGLIAALYRPELNVPGDGRPTGPWPGIALGATALLTVAGYAWAHASLQIEPDVFERFRALQLGLIRMDGVYLAVKLPELIFQQALIYVLVRHLQLRGLRGWTLIGVFLLPFAGIHVPLLVVKGLAGLPFLLASMAACLVFVPLIARFERGVAFSFCVHHLAYVIAGLALRAGL
jgi:hypothetical protein